jgi:hypothetical protein
LGETVQWAGQTKQISIKVYADADIRLGKTGNLSVDGGFNMIGEIPGVVLDAYWSSNFPSSVVGYSIKAEGFYFFEPENDYAVTGQARLFWRNTEYRPTFAELVLMSDIRVGVFAQYSYMKDMVGTDLIAGAFVSADTNILGLVAVPADLMLGWDFLYDKFYFALSLGK